MSTEFSELGESFDLTRKIIFNCTSRARIPTDNGDFILHYYRNNLDNKEHLALVYGEIAGHDPVLVRVHSECFTGDVMGSLRCDCGPQLHAAMRMIAEEGRGVIIYLRQEGRGIGLEMKLRAYNLQDAGYDTVDANLLLGHQADERNYLPAVYILRDLGLHAIRLLTNNPTKIEALRSLGIHVTDRVPLQVAANHQNIGYLTTKVQRMRHLLEIDSSANDGRPMTASPTPESNRLHPQIVHADRFQTLRERAADHHRRTGRPLVTLSYAQSLDGCLTAQPGEPFAISSPQSLAWTHTLRASHDAILVGIGTVLADDPSLTVRFAEGVDPQPVVVDSHLRLPLTTKLIARSSPLWVATTDQSDPIRRQHLEAHGARVLTLPTVGTGVDLAALLDQLGAEGVRSMMVEGGAEILTSFWRSGLAQQAIITIAPILLGGLHAVRAPLYSANGVGLHFPRLRRPQSFNAGEDIILWGEIE
ncbi:MAG: GTP cyclohydrolase II [Caldilineaceae bacterium]|nr:GTP cyclohydrolase II [Caldilineaceae bacterium]